MFKEGSATLEKRVALVTGGARGIGEAIVRCLVGQGVKVYFTYWSSEDQAKALSSSLMKQGSPVSIRCDVRSKQDVEKTLDAILAKEAGIDILVNNAGIIKDGLFLTLEDADWQEVLDTNLGSVYFFAKRFRGR